MPKSRRRPNSCTTRTAAAARRSPRWCPAAASSPARRCAARCCSPACTCIPTPTVENAVILPDVDIGRGARLRNVIVERGVRIPDGLVVGEDPELDAKRFRRTENGICLITQPMIDRLRAMSAAAGSVRRLGDLSAGQDRRPRRRGRRAARRAGARRRRRSAPWSRAIPRSCAALAEAQPVHTFADLFGGPARVLAGAAAGLDLLVHRRAASLCPARQSLSRPRRARLAGQRRRASPRLRGSAADIGRGGDRRRSRRDIVHAHDWQAGLAPAYLHYGGGPRPGTVMTVHNLAFQGRFPGRSSARSACRRPRSASTASSITAASASSRPGLSFADRITTVSPTYAAEICTPEGGMGLDGLLRARAAVLHGILNGIDDAVWNPAADPRIVANLQRPAARRAPPTRPRCRRGSAWRRAGPLLFGVISRLTWQKGLDLAARLLCPRCSREGASSPCSAPASRRCEAAFRAAAASSRTHRLRHRL